MRSAFVITGEEAGAEEYYQQANFMNLECGAVSDTAVLASACILLIVQPLTVKNSLQAVNIICENEIILTTN